MSQEIVVHGRIIGHGHPAYVIAEAGINHNGSLQTAKRLVDIASDAGADAVKFQLRNLSATYIEELVENPALAEMSVEYTLSNLKAVQLTDDEFLEVASYAEAKGIQFLASPWDVPSVDFLEAMEMPLYKIGSPDLTNFVLLERVIETGRPMMLSTGMSTEEEIEQTVAFLKERGATFALLHCQSTYPTPFYNVNLNFMETLRRRYNVPVGYSGHERGIAITEAAVAMGACIVEKHFTLARDLPGPDHAASLEPAGMQKLIRDIRHIEESRGVARRYLSQGEYNNRVALAKSLVATKDIAEGETIDRAHLTAKSPGKGISPQNLYRIVGTTALRDVARDRPLAWEDVRKPELDTFQRQFRNWGVVVRFSDIDEHDWGNPDVFEFRVNGGDLNQPFDLKNYPQRLSVHAPEQKGHDIIDLSSLRESRRKQSVAVTQQVIHKTLTEIAPHFSQDHIPFIVIHPGGITRDHMDLEQVPAMNEALKKSLDELDDDGVELLVENMPPLPWIFGGQQHHNNFMDAGEIVEFCRDTGRRICYDTSHAKLWCQFAGVDIVEHATLLRPFTAYLHVSDALGVDGEGIQIDEGDVDWARLMPVFEDFDGPIITEIWRGHERFGKGFKVAAERLSKYIGRRPLIAGNPVLNIEE